MKQKKFTVFFFLIGVIFLILENLNAFLPALITKALIIPSLMFFYHARVTGNYSLFHRIVMIAMFFSWLGDIFLQFTDRGIDFYFDAETYFLFALGAFLFTHLFYSLAFNIPKGKNKIFSTRIYQLFMIVGYGFLLIWLLYNQLITDTGNYRFSVILYAVFLHFMLGSALNRYGKVNGVSYMLVSIGALFFVFSHSLILINRFNEKIDFARILIMASYIFAQYFIAIGCLRQDFSRDEV